MNKIRQYIEYPYLKYLNWKNKNIVNTYNIDRKLSIQDINIWNLILFYLIALGLITISLAVFIAIFLIVKDIFS